VGASGEKVLSLPVPVAREPLSEGRGASYRSRVLAAPWTRRALVLLLALAVAGVLLPLGAGRLGHWLIVADPLERSQAIVVLSGRVPFRAMEAASIYRAGWAPEVWLTKEARTPEELALDRLGIPVIRGEAYNREVLERLGVPSRAIRVLDHSVWNTVDEERLIAGELGRIRANQVILVTSKTHSRRVRATWSAIVGRSPRAITRYAEEEPYNSESWWRNTRDALDVSREVFGLVNVWAGFPVQPDRGQR
jgi:uncharacterized SAM-binding protein YcdF (DUF218 family)